MAQDPEDIAAFFKVRALVRDAIDRSGEVFSSVIGPGLAAIEFEMDGWRFNVTIRPIPDPVPRMKSAAG